MLKVMEKGALREAGRDLFELDEIALAGARRMLMATLDTEAADYVERHRDERDADGRALVETQAFVVAQLLTPRHDVIALSVELEVGDARLLPHADWQSLSCG